MHQWDDASEPLSKPPTMSSTSMDSGASKRESNVAEKPSMASSSSPALTSAQGWQIPRVTENSSAVSSTSRAPSSAQESKSSHSRAQQPSRVVSEAHAGGRRPALPAWEHPSTMRETPGGAQPARAGEPPRVTYPTPLALSTPPNVVEWSSSSSTPVLPSTDDRSTLSASKPPTMKGEPGPSDVHQGLGKKQAVTRAELRPARRTEQWATSAGVEWGTSPYAEDAGAVGGTEWEVGDSYAAGKDPDTGDLGDMNDWREWNAPFDDDDAHEPSGGVPLDVGPSAKPKETRDDRRDGKARQEHERKKKPQGDTHDGQKKKPPSIRPSGREKAKAKPRASTFQAPKHHRDNSKAANAERHHYDFASDEWKKLRKEHFNDIPLMEIGPEAELASNPAFRSLRCRVDDLEGRVEQLTRMLAQAEAIAMDARRVVQQFESDRANDRYLRTLKMDDLERDVDILKIDVRTTESKQNQCSQRLQQLSTASKDVVDIAERRETQLQAIVEDTVGRLKTATLCAEKTTKHINDVEERLRAEMEAKYELEEKRTTATRAELFSDLQFTHDFQGQLARDVDMIKNLHVRTMEWECEIEDLDSAMMSPMFTMSGVRDMQLVLYPKGSKSHKSGSSLPDQYGQPAFRIG
eukprot:GEMP01014719.1.p1 GENE.GEMP01014719.1~~GEMP01014719.1.p1  ORF type:complete len:635 (+),score=175.03 GEMP01014719.1:262-2166(+)